MVSLSLKLYIQVKILTHPFVFFGLAAMAILTSCGKDPEPVLRIGLVGGLGGFTDRGFNQNILAGFQKAEEEFHFDCEERTNQSESDLAVSIGYFVSEGFDMIITSGYDASQATIDAAIANPGIDFVILDFSMASPPPNLLCAVFDVDQSSFPCGFLAAYWANRQNPSGPLAGFVAGPDFPDIRQFSVSYTNGVTYFNTMYQKNVGTAGYFAGSFSDTLQGAALADSLIKQHASVIFAFAGTTGKGALYKVKEAGKWAIGVDVDQYYSIPDVRSVLLTSCVKKLDTVVYSIMQEYRDGIFPGGQVKSHNLGNGGVSMAPFHDYSSVIPDSIKTALTNIEAGIKNGTIKTGWEK